MKLYEIAADMRRALDGLRVDEETGELIDLPDLDGIESRFQDKVEAVACYIKELRADAAALKTEEDALKARRLAVDRKAARMVDYLARCMQSAGQSALETPRVQLSFRASEQVHVIDLQLFGTEFLRIRPPEPDKPAIRAALKAGRDVPGAELVHIDHLQIK